MRHFVIGLSFFVFSLHAQTSGPVSAALEGDIVNATANAPIENARVRLQAGQDDPLYLKADRQGHFAFTNLTPGVYDLAVDSPGYFQSDTQVGLMIAGPASGVVTRSYNVRNRSVMDLPAVAITQSTGKDGSQHTAVRIPLLPYAVIAGKVTDPYGLPMLNCTIEILRREPKQAGPSHVERPSVPEGSSDIVNFSHAETDDRGEYRVGGLEPGTYFVAVNKNGMAWQNWENADRITYFPSATGLDGAQPIELAAGQVARADVRGVRKAGVRMAGKLIRPPGGPEPTVAPPGTGQPHLMLYTNLALQPQRNPLMNANGPTSIGRQDDYEFRDVLPGKYKLLALTRDASTDRLGPDQKPVYGFAQNIEVGDHDIVGFDIALQPLRDLPGQVKFGEGCRPAPLSVSTAGHNQISAGQSSAVSEPDGRFVLTGLTTGTFAVQVFWQSRSGPPLEVTSIRLGNRDVQKDGLEIPYSGDETLQIAVFCGANGGLR